MADSGRRRALVTGGAVRVGGRIAGALARNGYDVAVHANDSVEAARLAVAEFCAAGASSEVFQADLRRAEQIGPLVAEAAAFLGGLDLLVCSAAAFQREAPGGLTAEAWDALFSLNARAPYLCARAAAPLMDPGASIINVVDVAGLEAWPGYVTYAASKAALISLTRSLAVALAPDIRVNGVAPGPVLSPEAAGEAERAALDALTLPGLSGSPTDVAEAVLYLDRASYVTGQILRVDGGQTLR